MKTKFNPFLRNLLTVATFAFAGAAQADDYTTDTTGLWSDAIWNPGLVTGPTANTDTATINSGGNVTINSLTIDSPIAINSGATVVANAEVGVANVTLGGNLTGSGTLTKTGGWSLLLGGDNSGFSGTINANVSNILFTADSAGSAAADWVLSSGANVVNFMTGTGHTIKLGSLAGTGGYLGGGNASGAAATFEIGGNGKSTTFSGSIVNTPPGWGGGTVALTKVGAGSLIFLGGLAHTNVQEVGTVVVNDGLLRTENWGQWNSNLDLTVNGSGIFEMWNGKVSLANLSGNGTVRNTVDYSEYGSGNPAVGNTLTVAAGSFSGTITDLGVTTGGPETGDTSINLVKTSAGTLTLSGTNSYNGTTTVDEGTLVLGNGTNNSNLADGADVSIDSDATLQLNYSVGNVDDIDELWLGGVQAATGTWGPLLSTADHTSALITGTGFLNVLTGPPVIDPFANWMSTNYPSIVFPDNQPEADPDNDGMKNLLEFVLNGIPNVSDPAILPDPTVTATDFEFTYTRRIDSAATSQVFQYCSDLSSWTTNTIVIPATDPGSGPARITPIDAVTEQVKITVAKGANTKLFGRLQVVK